MIPLGAQGAAGGAGAALTQGGHLVLQLSQPGIGGVRLGQKLGDVLLRLLIQVGAVHHLSHAAQQIARKLSAIAKKKQTLCVTHLPQIAAMGDHHLRISKTVREGRSYTDVSPMDRAHRVDEIARLLSGEQISEAARRNAEELLEAAGQGG